MCEDLSWDSQHPSQRWVWLSICNCSSDETRNKQHQSLLVNQLWQIMKSPGSVRDSRRQGRSGRKEPWHAHLASHLCSPVHLSSIPHPRISSESEEWRKPPEHQDRVMLTVMHCAIFFGVFRRVLRRAGSRVGPRGALSSSRCHLQLTLMHILCSLRLNRWQWQSKALRWSVFQPKRCCSLWDPEHSNLNSS